MLVGSDRVGLGGTQWGAARGALGGELVDLDPDLHLRLAGLVRHLVLAGLVGGVHDLSAGGLGTALAEMAVRSGVGLHVARVPDHRALFGEGPSRVVLAVHPDRLVEVLSAAEEAKVPAVRLGLATGDRFVVKDLVDLPLAVLTTTYGGRLPEALDTGTSSR